MYMRWHCRIMSVVVMALPKIAVDASVIINEQVSEDVFRLELLCPEIAAYSKPGMFVQIRVDKGMLLLRRPFGIADVKDKSITVFYRVLGEGTKALTSVKSGDLLNVLGPLGNGFKTDAKRPLLVGGGMGLAPLLYLARFYQGKADILMGGRNKQEIFWEKYFRPYANNIFITTDDGSVGTKGFTTNLLPQLLTDTKYDLVAVCGPGIMMQLISDIAAEYEVPCQVSLEKRMACGLGACLSCAVDTKDGQRKKVCKDGPVFWAEEVQI